jgi:hypothetical protein
VLTPIILEPRVNPYNFRAVLVNIGPEFEICTY